MKRWILLVIIVLISNPVFADIKKDMAFCASLSSDANRLICYDEVSKILGVDKPDTTIHTGSGKWNVSESVSKIDDSTSVFMILDAEEMVQSGYKDVRPLLAIRCSENKTELFIAWDLFLGSDNITLLTRLDKKKAITSTWSLSTNSKSTFAKNSIYQIKQLMAHNKLLAQVTPFNENPIMITFDLRGLSEVIKPLRKACQW